MAALWLRQARLTFGYPGWLGVAIEDLRIRFIIKKNSESNSNSSRVLVYNLKPENRAILELGIKGKNMFAILEAGYKETGYSQIFRGDIDKSLYARKGADWVTTIILKDGGVVLEKAHHEKSYSGKVDLKNVITDTAKKLKEVGGIIIDNIKNLVSDPLNTGYTAEGMAKDILDDLMPRQNKEWWLENKKLIILGPKETSTEEEAVISASTGLIGSPVRREEGGIEFTSLIQPGIYAGDPGGRVKIISKDINGSFRVRKTDFKGDTHGKHWYIKTTAVPI